MKFIPVLMMFVCPFAAYAQGDIESTQRALALISDFANTICANPAYKGATVTVGAEAKVGTDIGKLLKNLANVNLQIGAKGERQTFDGLAQKDLLEATKAATDCRLKVFSTLTDRLLARPQPTVHRIPEQRVTAPANSKALPFDAMQLDSSKRQTVLAAREQIERAETAAAAARDAEQAAERAVARARRGDPLTKVFEGTGVRYEGEWANDNPSGFGRMSWFAPGSPSLGESFSGQMNSWIRVRGVFSYPPPKSNAEPYGGTLRYEGDWLPTSRNRAGNWNGFGAVKYRDGTVYRGQIVDGDFDGYGTLFRPDASRVEGKWKASSPVPGESVRWSSDGNVVN